MPTDLSMANIVEGIRQLVLKSKRARVDGLKLTDAVEIQTRLIQIDVLCVEIEARMEHAARPSMANGLVGEEIDNPPGEQLPEEGSTPFERAFARREQRYTDAHQQRVMRDNVQD